jgi:hypothetical protein
MTGTSMGWPLYEPDRHKKFDKIMVNRLSCRQLADFFTAPGNNSALHLTGFGNYNSDLVSSVKAS